jgi:XapX domain-containing protein
MVMQSILATIAGFAVGFLFSLLKLPVPAPNELPGVLGIVGMFLGYVVAKSIFKH